MSTSRRRDINVIPEDQISFKDRLASLRMLPPFFKLVWGTHRGLTLLNIILRMIRAGSPVAMLYIGKMIIDQVVQISQHRSAHPPSYIWELVALEFGLAILTDALARASSLFDGLLGDLFAKHTSIRIMKHAATLDLDQFEDSEFYDKLERARQQTSGRTVLLSQVMMQVQDIISMVFLAAGLMVFNPWLILLLLIAIVPAFLGESHFNNKSYALSRSQTQQRRELDYLRYLGASDETAKEIKIFDLSGFIIDRFKALADKFYTDGKQLAISRASWGSFFAFLGSTGYYAAYIAIIAQTINGHLSIGDLTFLAGSFRQLRSLLEGILNRFTSVSQGAIYLRDFFEFFEIGPKITQVKKPLPFPNPVLEGFRFEDVGFRYARAGQWANRHLNFTFHPGEKLALVGENGAGKTTLVKLLIRLYDPSEGRILLDGVDLKEYDLLDLRMNIGVIFQDFLRYQMSFSQNIAAGNIKEIDNTELIKEAARQSLADTLAMRLPDQYEQKLGRRFNQGIDLSGGEWQKIALARAYMKDAKVLILDEPTAALDARAEYQVFQRFSELTKGKSAILISHRFSTVRMANRILLLERGELKEIGSHEELLAQGGRYAELFKLQAMGYR